MRRDVKKGFTLLEIIAVISLLIVISSMAIPVYTNIVDTQKKRADLVTALQMADMAKTFYIEKSSTDGAELKKYIVAQFGGEDIKSKYNPSSSFTVTLDATGKKPTVTITDKANSVNIVLVNEGKANPDLEK